MAENEGRCPRGKAGTLEAFQERMKAQCEAIEQYQLQVIQEEGRQLSLEEAAREWIDRYADDFADNEGAP